MFLTLLFKLSLFCAIIKENLVAVHKVPENRLAIVFATDPVRSFEGPCFACIQELSPFKRIESLETGAIEAIFFSIDIANTAKVAALGVSNDNSTEGVLCRITY